MLRVTISLSHHIFLWTASMILCKAPPLCLLSYVLRWRQAAFHQAIERAGLLRSNLITRYNNQGSNPCSSYCHSNALSTQFCSVPCMKQNRLLLTSHKTQVFGESQLTQWINHVFLLTVLMVFWDYIQSTGSAKKKM